MTKGSLYREGKYRCDCPGDRLKLAQWAGRVDLEKSSTRKRECWIGRLENKFLPRWITLRTSWRSWSSTSHGATLDSTGPQS